MLLTPQEQRDTLYAAARSAGIDVERDEIDWRDGTVDAGAVQLHYLDWGAAGQRPLLLLHGGLQTAHSWDLIAVVLKRRFHVVAMDLRGHGDSGWAPDGEDYGYAAHTRDIDALLRHLGWERLVIMGVSLGGLATMNVAAEHPDRLDAAVIIDVGPELNAGGVGRIVDFGRGPAELDSIEEFVQRAIEYNPRRRPEQLRHSLTHNLRQLPSGKWTWKYDTRITRRPRSTGDGGETRSRNSFAEMWDALRLITCPALVVRGAGSDVFQESTARRMIELLPNGSFATVPAAGHTVPQDNPQGFLRAVDAFFAEHGLAEI